MLLQLALLGAAAMSANTLPEPGKAARVLSHQVVEQIGGRFRLTPDSARRRLVQSLVGQIRAYKPASCDPVVPACRSAAESLASEKATDYGAHLDTAFEEGYAALFESRMSEPEIEAASRFVKSPSGAKFAAALVSSEMQPMIVLSYISSRLRDYEDDLYDRFLAATTALPRRVLRVPPPVWPSGDKK